MTEAMDLRRRLLPPGHPPLGAGLRELGILLLEAGDLEEAEAYTRNALGILKGGDGPRHHVAAAHDALARVLARFLDELGPG